MIEIEPTESFYPADAFFLVGGPAKLSPQVTRAARAACAVMPVDSHSTVTISQYTFAPFKRDVFNACSDALASGKEMINRSIKQFRALFSERIKRTGNPIPTHPSSTSPPPEDLSSLEGALKTREQKLNAITTDIKAAAHSEIAIVECMSAYLTTVKLWNATLDTLSVALSEKKHQQLLNREKEVIAIESSVQEALKKSYLSYFQACMRANELYILNSKELGDKMRETKQIFKAPVSDRTILDAQVHAVAHQSDRPHMEDRWVDAPLPEFGGRLCAVFDGHGTSYVSSYAQDHLVSLFKTSYKEGGEMEKILQRTIRNIHETCREALHDRDLDVGGTTAVICFLDQKKGLLYTATLGDSAAVLWTKKREDKFKWTCLSVIYDWDSDSERDRLSQDCPEATIEPSKALGPSRLIWQKKSMNISRSVGDYLLGKAISQEAVVTCMAVKPEDVIVLGTDGMWDNNNPLLKENHELVLEYQGRNIADVFAQVSISRQTPITGDNTTVLSMEITASRS